MRNNIESERFFGSGVPLDHYDASYVRKYITRTLEAPYTKYKNRLLASIAEKVGLKRIVDIGGNVSGILRLEGSLRYQLEKLGIGYAGVDLIKEYFDPEMARELGIPEEYIYNEVEGYVADIENLPFEDKSVEGLVCADVIEHVPHPKKAFVEISRVLTPDGRALFIIPSMYKLDLFDFDYVEEKRTSSHESKQIIDDWKEMWEEAGLELDVNESRPIGIATGLSYLSWVDDEVIPERPTLDSEDAYSDKALVHKEAKRILGDHDEEIDAYILEHGYDELLVAALQHGDVKSALRILTEIIPLAASLTEDEKEILKLFFAMIEETEYDEERTQHIVNTFARAKEPRLLLGNSVLVVLKHKGE